jgi:hypothetical protein
MSQYLITEVNCETGEVIERPMTKAEADQRAVDDANYASAKAEQAVKATQKAALLQRLGITAEEATLLLG